MKILALLVLLFAQLAFAATPNPTLVPLASNTALDLGAYTCNQPTANPTNCAGITDYSGFWYDTTNTRMLMFGGGHSTTHRTDVDTFSMATLTWTPDYQSTDCPALTLANINTTNGSYITTGHPVGRHTYDMVVPLASEMILLTMNFFDGSGSCYPLITGGPIEGRVGHYNYATKTWTYATTAPGAWNFDASAEYDPVSGLVIIVASSPGGGAPWGIWTYNPTTKVSSSQYVLTTSPDWFGGNTGWSLVYYPPNQKMYLFNFSGQVREITLDRANFANSTVVTPSGITGANNNTGTLQIGWAYDSVNQIIGGGIEGGKFNAYNPVAKTWTSTTMGGGYGSISMQGRSIGYDPVNNVFIFIHAGTGGNTCGSSPSACHTFAYRYISDFDKRCAAPGVIRCNGFDSAGDLGGELGLGYNKGYFNNNPAGCFSDAITNCPILDTSVKASGAGSMKFTTVGLSGGATAGQWFTRFTDGEPGTLFGAGESFYIQYRIRITPEMARNFLSYSAGDNFVTAPKLHIIGAGDENACNAGNRTGFGSGGPCASSCTEMETVTTQGSFTGSAHWGLSHYNGCGFWTSYGEFFDGIQVRKQRQGPPLCYYPNDPNNGCFYMVPNTWMTVKVKHTIGAFNAASNRIEQWMALEGQPSVKIWDSNDGYPANTLTIYSNAALTQAGNHKYGKVWLVPYMTNKDGTENHATGYTYYDELIISTQDIADPSGTVPATPTSVISGKAVFSGAVQLR